jgi:PAS domain S-box-containing protein
MHLREINQLVTGTSDAAFAVDGTGTIAAWNQGAADLFGIAPEEAIGQPCGAIVQGIDECGTVCSEECTVRQAASKHHPVRNFDLQIETSQGKKWCNISVIIVDETSSVMPYTVHLIRLIDVRKRLELLVRDFVVSETDLSEEKAVELISSTRSALRETYLTRRELEILRLAAKGATSATIADNLHISPNTVDNHMQHILKKLNAHSRLEAIRRAEHAGLL